MHPNKDSVVDTTRLTPYIIYILGLITVIIVLKLYISLISMRDLNNRIRN
jgi:type II secretory pathway component PulF